MPRVVEVRPRIVKVRLRIRSRNWHLRVDVFKQVGHRSEGKCLKLCHSPT